MYQIRDPAQRGRFATILRQFKFFLISPLTLCRGVKMWYLSLKPWATMRLDINRSIWLHWKSSEMVYIYHQHTLRKTGIRTYLMLIPLTSLLDPLGIRIGILASIISRSNKWWAMSPKSVFLLSECLPPWGRKGFFLSLSSMLFSTHTAVELHHVLFFISHTNSSTSSSAHHGYLLLFFCHLRLHLQGT